MFGVFFSGEFEAHGHLFIVLYSVTSLGIAYFPVKGEVILDVGSLIQGLQESSLHQGWVIVREERQSEVESDGLG